MKDGNWTALDKNLARYLPRDRPYTILEAMFSYSKDIDENKENSIHGYSRIWSWSRTKVRRFVTDLKTSARHEPDRDETGARQEIRLINNNLKDTKDPRETGTRPAQDRDETITINPNPNTFLCEEIILDLNTKGGYKFKASDSTKKHILARLSEGFTKEDFFKVHSVKIAEWKDNPKMAKFIRPKTLYLPDNFQSYLNQKLTLTKRIMGPDGMYCEVVV